MTVKKLGHYSAIKIISTGGREILETVTKDISHDIMKTGSEAVFREMAKQTMKQTEKTVSRFALTQSATIAAASKEFTKNAWKLTGTDYIFAGLKGGINYLK